MALSVGILSRSILNGTHTVPLQHSWSLRDKPVPLANMRTLPNGNAALAEYDRWTALD